MPSKFSCRQLRETGQCFESFLVVRGLDMETDRERLRTIYNRDFKTRYGPAHSLAQNRGPSAPPRPPRRGHLSRPGARKEAAPPVAQPGPGAAQTSPPAPCPRPASAARSPPALPRPGPCAESARVASRAVRSLRPQAGSRVLRPRAAGGGWGGAGRGGGEPGRGPGRRGSAGRELPAGGAEPGLGLPGTPAPFWMGCIFGGRYPRELRDLVWEGESQGIRQRRKRHELHAYQTSVNTCGFSMETQGEDQDPGGPLSPPFPVTIQVKKRLPSVKPRNCALKTPLSAGCSLGPKTKKQFNMSKCKDIQINTAWWDFRLNHRPPEKDWVFADEKASMAAARGKEH